MTERSFPQFSKFPIEIKLLVWEQFYLEPRHFMIKEYQWNNGDRRGLPSKSNTSWTFNTLTWCFHAASSSSKHYNDIDTTIDRVSSSVASRLRPRFWLPTWSLFHEYNHLEYYDKNCCTWSSVPSRGALEPWMNQHRISADPRINWNTDFIHFAFDPKLCFPRQFDWLANIQNVVTGAFWNPTTPSCRHYRWLVEDMSSWDSHNRLKKLNEHWLLLWHLYGIIQTWVLDQTSHTEPNSCAWWCSTPIHTYPPIWPCFVRRSDCGQLRELEVTPECYILSERDITKNILLRGRR